MLHQTVGIIRLFPPTTQHCLNFATATPGFGPTAAASRPSLSHWSPVGFPHRSNPAEDRMRNLTDRVVLGDYVTTTPSIRVIAR